MKSLKKKFWSKTIIGVLILGFLFAPVSVNTHKINKEGLISKNISLAQVEISLATIDIKDVSGSFNATLTNTESGYTGNGLTWEVSKPGDIILVQAGNLPIQENTNTQVLTINVNGLSPNTNYELKAYLIKGSVIVKSTIPFTTSANSNTSGTSGNNQNDTNDFSGNGNPLSGGSQGVNSNSAPKSPDYGCEAHPSTWGNCLIMILYKVVFTPISYITRLAADFLDFFVFYSIGSDAYKNDFILKAWSVVRDISNMLFIIALLYIGIKTILGMNSSNNKRLIGIIVIIALVINFSLFVSRVVIDASNILARVFYNNITPYDANGKIEYKPGERKSVTVGLLATFDPQEFIAEPVTDIKTYGVLTILGIILMVYMIFMFISMSMLFVGRVAGLWILMIFSPLAFVSAAMPFNIPSFNFSKWFSELLRYSFMAPIFAFFLYIVILFGGFLKEIPFTQSTSSGLEGWMDKLLQVVIPFILILLLLKKAKEITKEYAGEAGQAFSKAGSMVGGLALGVATGGVAALGRRAIGGYLSSQITGSQAINAAASKKGVGGWVARQALVTGSKLKTKSFDLREAKVAGYGLADTGLQKLGKAKTGGFAQIQEDQIKRREERAALLASTAAPKEREALQSAEMAIQQILRKNIKEKDESGKEIEYTVAEKIESLDKTIKEKRQKMKESEDISKNLEPNSSERKEMERLRREDAIAIRDLENEKKAIKNASVFVSSKGEVKDYLNLTKDGKINNGALEDLNKEITSLEEAMRTAKIQEQSMLSEQQSAAQALKQAADSLKAAETEAKKAEAAKSYSPTTANIQAFEQAEQKRKQAQEAYNKEKQYSDEVAKKQPVDTTVLANKINKLQTEKTALETRINNEGSTEESTSIGHIENKEIPNYKSSIERQEKGVRWSYAERLENQSGFAEAATSLWKGFNYSPAAEKDAAQKIKMGAKIDTDKGK